MQKEVALENVNEVKEFKEFSKDKLAIAKICVLSTAPNSHELYISEEVLRRDIKTIQGQFIVAYMMYGDARSHDKEEVPVGYYIPNKDIEFEEIENNGNTVVKAWAYAVLSKQYAKEAYEMFVNDNHRATSIEMKVEIAEDGHTVLSFDAYGSTILGKSIHPSCPDAEISLVRFAEDANSFFNKKEKKLTKLKDFVEERKMNMAEENYTNHPINTSKEGVYKGEWNGEQAKQDLIKEKNYKRLAPKVCLKLEDGWENREATKLGYPVMGLYDGEWRYSTRGLASAKAYAKQHGEETILNKVEKIYDELDIESEGKEEDAKMEEETKMAESEEKVEEPKTEDEVKEDEAKMADEPEPEEDKHEDDHDELMARIAQLEADIADRDNIIMGCNAELEELRQFKADVEEKEKAMSVEAIMSEVKEFIDEKQFAEMREQGMACGKEELDGWANSVKAVAFAAVKKQPKKAKDNLGVWGFAAPITQNKNKGLWD